MPTTSAAMARPEGCPLAAGWPGGTVRLRVPAGGAWYPGGGAWYAGGGACWSAGGAG